MEKQKRWQFYLITAVIILTIYNILPTVFFYTKSLKKPIDQKQSEKIASESLARVNRLESDALSWVKSYAKLLGLKPSSVSLSKNQPQHIEVSFSKNDDAELFRKNFNRSGSLITFPPAQLTLAPGEGLEKANKVTILRSVPVHFNPQNTKEYFTYAEKTADNFSESFKKIVTDRMLQIGLAIAGPSENSNLVKAINSTKDLVSQRELVLNLSKNLDTYAKTFSQNAGIKKRFVSTLARGEYKNPKESYQSLVGNFQKVLDGVKVERIELEKKEKELKEKNEYLNAQETQILTSLKEKESKISSALALIKSSEETWSTKTAPLSYPTIKSSLSKHLALNTTDYNPIIRSLALDKDNQKLLINFQPDIQNLMDSYEANREKSVLKNQLSQIIINEIARVSRMTGEHLIQDNSGYEIELNNLSDASSLLVFDLSKLAQREISQLTNHIKEFWQPKSADLQGSQFPIWDYNTYAQLSPQEKKLGLLVYSPALLESSTPQGMKKSSIYVVARGVDKILTKYKANPSSKEASEFIEDFTNLRDLLKSYAYFGYPGTTYPLDPSFSSDFIFEKEDYFASTLKATRENFEVFGTKRYATLELTNVGQRILAENKIDDAIHEDLLRWRDEYNQAQIERAGTTKFDVPKPTKNVLLSNIALSAKKYFRGDDRKIIKWGLDLSGGKSVQLELRDSNNKKVVNETDLEQGIDELYKRVNKMGVSEVNIRREGSNITLDFPGAQGLSASELVRASSMYFHVVNEKYSPYNKTLREHVNTFLQDVWNEALVTNKKDPESINRIAWKHLYGESLDTDTVEPRSQSARKLYDSGLRLAMPGDPSSNELDDTMSKIAMIRGESFTSWGGQTNPLLIVFNNFALEGSNLQNVHASYDPMKGNFLGFEVRSTSSKKDAHKTNPRNDLYAWTSTYSKEKLAGSDLETITNGRGWRMAVILNGTVISSPALESALKDKAMITGSFTQREVNKLVADLKAGSLTYSPKILSEKNVSPELGIKERYQGILATVVAIMLVMLTMIGYYRFAGFVASMAVIFNLLMMWATLQNIHAALTLAGIAGIILTVGMAVDANVLVFERIREEFDKTKRLSLAIQAGYKKAFSAIFDSNITTIIAAVILLQFDSGPIKAFAVMLIIGIASSMFSALFMTRFFFQKWVQNPKNTHLTISSFFRISNFNFLRFGKLAITLSLMVVIGGASIMTFQKQSILGMDFTGGFALNVELDKSSDTNYRTAVEKALKKNGLTSQEFQVRELSPSNHVRIFLSKSLDNQGRPFYEMPLETTGDVEYSYENNPRIAWIMKALSDNGLTLTQKSLQSADSNWTSVSGQISNVMRNNALIGLAIALVCIWVYITLRFEFKYAICATVGLAHDIFVTIASISILHALKIPLQIDLNTIAALLTIVGYSLNDTIIIFDRIREDIKINKKLAFKDLVNMSLNKTFSRTIMTSLTTVLVLIALVGLGGSTIFGFALVMTIGVAYGTLSSLFIATPLLNYITSKESKNGASLNLKKEKQNSCG